MFMRLMHTLCVLVLALAPLAGARADASADAQILVNDATAFVQQLRAGKDGKNIGLLLTRSKGVIVMPKIIRAGLVIGGEGGNGVLLRKDEQGGWSHPAFVSAASASYGLQAGIKSYKLMMIVMHESVLDQILKGGLEFGGHISAAAGSEGLDFEGLSTTNAFADVYYYNMTDKGLFGGASLEGTGIKSNDKLNNAYYGKGASTDAILNQHKLENRAAEPLLRALK